MKAKNDAPRQLESVWDRWPSLRVRLPTFRTGRQPAEHRDTTGIDWRKANGTKGHPVWASVPIATEPSKHDLSVLRVLALNPIEVYVLEHLSSCTQAAGTQLIHRPEPPATRALKGNWFMVPH